MGKQGPCYHCGVTSTPLWRNGPPDKPVLCNACGSRWRTKGTLTNYTPLHSRLDFIDSEDYRSFKLKTAAVKTKEPKLQKRSHSHSSVKVGGEAPHNDLNFQKVVEEDTSNRSSSGSAISYTENSAHFVSRDGCDGTGSAQSTVWDSLVPSRKRTCVNRPKSSSVEKLKMDLYCILHQQQQKSSYLSGTSEEDLLFVSGTPMDSFEIGHGSVLLKHLTAAQEEESEASSLTLDKKTKTLNEVYSGSPTHHVSKGSKGKTFSSVADEKDKELAREGVEEAASRDKKCQFKPRVLWCSTSPLISINLRDVIGFEQFMRLTNEEQQHLKKYLPSTDTTKFPDILKSMFGSLHLLEAFSSFQQLLLEGIFDLSFPGINAEDSRNLKRLALVNLTKSNWVQYYQQLKVDKQEKTKGGKENTRGPSFFGCGTSSPVKRHGGQNQKFSELKDTMKSPKLMQKYGSIKLLDTKPPQPNCTDASLKSHYDKPDTDNDGFCFSPRSLFSFTPDRSSCTLDSLQFSAASSEQDLLFDVPSSMCFPQAELLDRGFGK